MIAWKHPNQSGYIIRENAYEVSIPETDPRYAEIAVYLAEHPEALVPAPVSPPPTSAQLAAQARSIRDAAFESVRWRLERNTEEQELSKVPTDNRMTLLLYRQALRDWPESPGFPDLSTMPVAP